MLSCLFYQWFGAWHISLQILSVCARAHNVCLFFHVIVQHIIIITSYNIGLLFIKVLGHFDERLLYQAGKMRFQMRRNLFRVFNSYDTIVSWIICSISVFPFSCDPLLLCVGFSFNNSRVFVYKFTAKVLLITNRKATYGNDKEWLR